MSTIKVVNVQHPSASEPSITLDSDGGMTGGFPSPNRNLLYNGAMQVAQRGTSTASITTGGYYTADRWKLAFSASNVSALTQSVQSDGPSGSGLTKSLKYLVTTADASPATGAVAYHYQNLEGQDVQRVAKGTASAKELTASFWIKSNVTGTYVVSLLDADNNRIVSASYSVSESATWEKKTITFPADTSGVLDNDNAGSLWLAFALYGGSDYTSGTLASSWQALDLADWFVGQTNLAAATNNYWQITGVQLEVGAVATPFEFKPYGQELRECQRYYYLHAYGTPKSVCMSAYGASSVVEGMVHFPVSMRTAPSLIASSGTNYYNSVRLNTSDFINSLTVEREQENCALVYNLTEASGTAGDGGWIVTSNAASSVAFSAEL